MYKQLNNLLLMFCCALSLSVVAEEGPEVGNDEEYVMVKNHDPYEADEVEYSFNIIDKVDPRHLSIPDCKDAPLDYKRCKYALCFENMPFGKVYRKLSGFTTESCIYVERSEGFGGLDCTIPNSQIEQIGELMEKHYDSLSNPEITFNAEEMMNLKNIYRNYCKVVDDHSQREVITMDKKIYGKDLLEELVSLPPAKSAITKFPQEINLPKAITPKVPVHNLYKSIMFREEDADRITLAAQNYLNPPAEKAPTVNTYQKASVSTSFYLNSIIYLSINNWAVWLNNYKLDYSSAGGIVKINSVDSESAEFLWETRNLDKISPNWRSKLQQINDKLYRSQDRLIQITVGAEENSYIIFKLKPNQTFVVQDLAIIEGKLK